MKNYFPYSSPEGYFESLQTRLSQIPVRRRRVSWVPYLALAASFLILLAVGTTVLTRSTRTWPSDDEVIEYLIESGTTLAQLEDAVNY
ncbi:MAG: hypothetical protein J6X82_00975 [Bacteroidales bacterium]|nr:hypothetical protein [Bacteroidales bacterium]